MREQAASGGRGDFGFRWGFELQRVLGLGCRVGLRVSALEITQGQIEGFLSLLPYKCHLEEVSSVGY